MQIASTVPSATTANVSRERSGVASAFRPSFGAIMGAYASTSSGFPLARSVPPRRVGPPLRRRIRRGASPCKPSRLYLGALVPYEPRVRILSAVLFPLTLLVPSVTDAQPAPPAPPASPAPPKQASPGQPAPPAPPAPQKQAQPGKKPEFTKGPVGKAVGACGVRILPLVEGNQWTYGFIAAHDRKGDPVPPR